MIADLLTGTFDEIVTSGPMHLPQWSPAGDKLMVKYQTHGRSAVGVMNTDGSGLKLVEASGFSWHTNVGVWSPTGSHLLYGHRDNLWVRFVHCPCHVQRNREKPPHRRQSGIGIPGLWA